jgi:hypothetical protein
LKFDLAYLRVHGILYVRYSIEDCQVLRIQICDRRFGKFLYKTKSRVKLCKNWKLGDKKNWTKKKELSWHHKNIRPYSEKPLIDKQTLVYFEKYLSAFWKELLWKSFEWFLRDLWVCLGRHNWPMIRWRRLRWSEKRLQKQMRSSAERQLKLGESVWKILSEKIDQFRWKNSQFCLKNSWSRCDVWQFFLRQLKWF